MFTCLFEKQVKYTLNQIIKLNLFDINTRRVL